MYALRGCLGGDSNIGIGFGAVYEIVGGDDNIGIGTSSLYWNASGNDNVCIGTAAGYGNTGGNYNRNTFIGFQAGFSQESGDDCIFIGHKAGSKQTAIDDLLIIDSIVRTNVAEELTNSILYGVMAATPAGQTIRLNARVGINVTPTGYLHLPAGIATAGFAPIKFTAGIALTVPEVGVLEFHDSKLHITNVAVRRVIDRTSDVIAATTSVTDTTDETTLWTGVIGANALKVGNILKIHVNGQITTATAADDITMNVYIGATLLATLNPAIGNVTADHWHLDTVVNIRTVGVGGTMAQHSRIHISDSDDYSESLDALNTTIVENITVTVAWDNAKVGNTISIWQGYLEFKN